MLLKNWNMVILYNIKNCYQVKVFLKAKTTHSPDIPPRFLYCTVATFRPVVGNESSGNTWAGNPVICRHARFLEDHSRAFIALYSRKVKFKTFRRIIPELSLTKNRPGMVGKIKPADKMGFQLFHSRS